MDVDFDDQETFHKSNPPFYAVIVIGDAGVGKTNLIYTFDKGRKPLAINPTIGVEFTSKAIRLPDARKIRAQIWDTAGQEQFRAITMRYLHIHPVSIAGRWAPSSSSISPTAVPSITSRSGSGQSASARRRRSKWDWWATNATAAGVQ